MLFSSLETYALFVKKEEKDGRKYKYVRMKGKWVGMNKNEWKCFTKFN